MPCLILFLLAITTLTLTTHGQVFRTIINTYFSRLFEIASFFLFLFLSLMWVLASRPCNSSILDEWWCYGWRLFYIELVWC